jgi:hypothetical protein
MGQRLEEQYNTPRQGADDTSIICALFLSALFRQKERTFWQKIQKVRRLGAEKRQASPCPALFLHSPSIGQAPLSVRPRLPIPASRKVWNFTHFQIFGGAKMRNQIRKNFQNFFRKDQGSPALYFLSFVSESNGKGVDA